MSDDKAGDRLTPDQRALRARAAAFAMHSRNDSREVSQPARDAFWEKFLDQVDPDRVLGQRERERRARAALKAHMATLAYRSSVARNKRRARPKRDGA